MNKNKSSTALGGFPRTFWIANSVELLERAAYYGVFIVITLYLSRILVHFCDDCTGVSHFTDHLWQGCSLSGWQEGAKNTIGS